jgi:hypothetical protein
MRITRGVAGVLICVVAACGPAKPAGDDGDDGGDDGPDAAPMGVCPPGTTEPCYSGAPGTQGVGTCVAGSRTCDPSGNWGSCNGEVPPILEVCANGLDDDCNGAADDIFDLDGDGFTSCDGDCCETTMQCGDPVRVNPNAAEAPTATGGIPVDDDCDGVTDEVDPPCDGAFAIDDGDPTNAARAIGICNATSLVTSAWARANGTPSASSLQNGILADFGPNMAPREGGRMLALSSGYARDATDPNACGLLSCMGTGAGTAPAGFPQDVPGCPGLPNILDDVSLNLRLRAPANATGYSVDFAFYSFEYPEWVCTEYNDQFIILVNPAPMGAINGNIAFDANTNPVSVNVAFFTVCAGCPDGTANLTGTGFDTWNDAGATVWLRSQAPVTAGQEFDLRFAIWDTGDANFDSTVLIDNFQWILEGSPGVETTPIE